MIFISEMLKRFSEITMNDVATCGGKGASLGEMMGAGLPIPNGFVVTTEAYGKNSKEWEKEVLQAFDKLNTKFVAVRSSGTKEDGADDSFAGQFDTYLFITRENLIKKIKECHDSVNSERIVSYCEYKGIDIKSIKVAVVIQKMVNSGSAGVCFTVNPVSQNYDEIMIDAGFGVGEAVVSGMITPDNYIVNKKTGEINKIISQQEKKLVLSDKGGTREVDIPKEEQNNQKLSDKHIQELAELAKKIEKHYGKPMDTEWAIENGELFMLQARPITTLGDKIETKRYTIYPAGDFNTSFISNYSVVLGYTKFPKLLGLPICDGPHVVRNGDLEYIFDMSTWDACEKSIVEKMDKDINYIDNLTDKMMGEGKNLCERIKKKSQNPNLKKLKNEELLKILEEFIEYQSNIYAYGTSFNFIGYGEDNYITKNLNKIFKEKNIPEGKINEVMEIFTYPYKDSFSQQQKIEILELLNKYINKYKKDFINDCKNKDLEYIQKKYSDFFEELKSHSEKYSRLSFGFTGPASNISDFFNDIKKIISDKVSINDRLESIKNKRIDNEKKKKFWMNKLNPNKNEKLLLETAGKIVRAKPTRKDYQSQAYCLLEPIIIEISNRLQTDTSTVWQMSISNMREFLKGKYDSNLQAKFQSFYICVPKNPEKVDVLTGENAHEFYDDNVLIEKDGIDVQDNVIHGNTACKGSAKGVVKIINSKNDMSKMETGNILVSVATSPSIVAAMKKAAAIITDSGGLTCHAAIVSRELGIPCVIGTKIATQVLKDGDLVEVDADNGIIKILENESKGDKLEVKIGNKTFTPESRSHSQVYFNYQGLPFFTSLFEKCSALEESRYSTSGLYISKFTGDNKIVSYCAGDFISKGYNMINDLLDQKDDAKKFLAQKNDLVIECIKKCEEYINSKRTDFFNIWNDIQTAFAAGRYVFNISHALQDYLDKLKESNYDLFECLQLNISPREETFLNKAETYLLNLVDKNPNDFDIVYRKFMDKYYWFQNSYLGVKTITKDWLFNYYETLISKRQVNVVETKKPELPDKYKLLIETASNAAFYQDNKKRLGLIANVIMDRWLKDISKQTNIPYDDLIWLTVVEIESYDISTKKGLRDLKNIISNYKNLGKRFWVLNENIYVDTNEDLWSKVVNLNTGNGDGVIVKGAVGNKGKYIGKAKIVLNIEKDGKKLEKGDILVTGMTRPEFLPMMQRAGAFITDEGGITCHAAIVSRELGKPCIIGTKIATQVLKDGDLVEVDADNGIVKILENTNGEKGIETENNNDLTKKFNELKRYNQRDIQTFNAYPFFINSVATVSAFNLLPYDLHYTQILCEYENDTVKWHYDIKDYENLGKIFWGKCKSTTELLKLIDKYDIDYRQSEKEFDKALSIYKKNKSEENRTKLLEKSVQFLACGAGSAHILECASYYAEKYFTKGKIITPHDESFLSKAHKLAKKLKSEYDLKKAYKEFLKEYGRIKNTYLGRNMISIQEFSDLADEKDLRFTAPKYKKNSIEEMISYTFNRQDRRKENIFKAIEKVDEVLNQISKDTGINKKSLSYMLPNEISKINNKDFQEELENRELYFIDYTTKKEHYFSSQHIDEQKNEEKLNELKEIKGSIGNPGKVTGTARICQNLESIKNFNEGEILVTSMTRPEFITAMRMASAFVTDEGGITCHAAIISRELGKPCIIGTKIATKVLKDGDFIEVDADNGVVKILQ